MLGDDATGRRSVADLGVAEVAEWFSGGAASVAGLLSPNTHFMANLREKGVDGGSLLSLTQGDLQALGLQSDSLQHFARALQSLRAMEGLVPLEDEERQHRDVTAVGNVDSSSSRHHQHQMLVDAAVRAARQEAALRGSPVHRVLAARAAQKPQASQPAPVRAQQEQFAGWMMPQSSPGVATFSDRAQQEQKEDEEEAEADEAYGESWDDDDWQEAEWGGGEAAAAAADDDAAATTLYYVVAGRTAPDGTVEALTHEEVQRRGLSLDECTPVSRVFPSWNRCILTEIYLCHACSYHEIEDENARTGRRGRAGGPARAGGFAGLRAGGSRLALSAAGAGTGAADAGEHRRVWRMRRRAEPTHQPLTPPPTTAHHYPHPTGVCG
jgi:hypothetical protein